MNYMCCSVMHAQKNIPVIKKLYEIHCCFYFNVYYIQGWYAGIVTTRWFAMRIDLLSAGFLAFVVFASIPLASGMQYCTMLGYNKSKKASCTCCQPFQTCMYLV